MQTKPKVVVVSSSPERLETLRGWLVEMDLEVCPASSCAEAYLVCAEQPAPGLVISDVSLCDGNWYLVLKRIVDLGLDCEFLVATAGANHPTGRMLASGVESLLEEPLDKLKTVQAVSRLLHPAPRRKESLARKRSKPRKTATCATG